MTGCISQFFMRVLDYSSRQGRRRELQGTFGDVGCIAGFFDNGYGGYGNSSKQVVEFGMIFRVVNHKLIVYNYII
jgi:hypothetical protein